MPPNRLIDWFKGPEGNKGVPKRPDPKTPRNRQLMEIAAATDLHNGNPVPRSWVPCVPLPLRCRVVLPDQTQSLGRFFFTKARFLIVFHESLGL